MCAFMKPYSNELIGLMDDISTCDIILPTRPLRDPMKNVEELAESIKKIGLLQPIVVRTIDSGTFEIVAGNRRFNACKKLGKRKITCHVVDLDDKSAFEVSLIENVHRHSLNPIDEALAFRKYVNEYGWGGMSELAHKISLSPSYICKRIKLLDLPKGVIDLISKSEIRVSAAEELLSVTSQYNQFKMAKMICDKKMSSRNARKLIKEYRNFGYKDSSVFTENHQNLYAGERLHKTFNKAIIALRITINKLSSIIESVEDNWVLYDILLQHRNNLNAQIDLLIKQKKKINEKFLRCTQKD